MICEKCGKEIDENNSFSLDNEEKNGERSWFITFLLSWLTGVFGLHRFYTGYIGIGIAQALTLGGFGIWAFVDFVCICIGEYKTQEGKKLNGYIKCFGIASLCVFISSLFIKFIINITRLLLHTSF